MVWENFLLIAAGLYLILEVCCEEEPWPRLVWTELRLKDSTAKLQSLPANPDDYILSSSISTRYYYTNKPAHWIAIANDFGERTVFWSDSGQKRIMKGGLGDAATASSIFQGTSSSVDGIAVDWLAKTLYWVDEAYNWIVVTDYFASNLAILIDTGLAKPRGIATHPQQGYLFWTDWGTGNQKIERSSLAGEDRVVLIDEDLFFPNGLTIDFATDRLYWTDVNVQFSSIKSTDLNGKNLTTVLQLPSSTAHFFDLTVFQNYLFVTDWRNYLRCVKIKEASHYFALNLGSRPYGITVFGNQNQPNGTSPCARKPCSQICVSDSGPDQYKCICKDGYELIDSQCKKREVGISSPHIIFSKSDSLCGIPGNFPDMALPAHYTAPCFLQNLTHVVALQLDSEEKLLFYSDAELRRVMSVRLTHGSNINIIMGGVGSVEGIAVDWIGKNLYMTDYDLNCIIVSRYEGSRRKILLDTDINSPRSIAIDPRQSAKLLFWSEFGEPAQIERAYLDGSNRRVIVSEPLVSPNGLTIDYISNKLFFADRSSGKIESVDYDGSNRKLVFAKPAAHYFDMDIYQDYLLFTEWNENTGVHAIEFESGREQKNLLHDGIAYGIKTFSTSRQPTDITDSSNVESCLNENGGCEHLCLPSAGSQGYQCDCSTGYRLHTDGRSCVTDIMDDNFILLADSYLHGIFQVSLSGSINGYTSVPLGTMSNPVGLDYDPVDEMVYWTDVEFGTINRAKLDGFMRTIIASSGVESADGIAVDSIARLIFWTDATKKTIEVSKLNGVDRTTIIDTDLDKPRAIAVDSVSGVIYWSDWGTEPRIEKANMDGSNRTVLVNTGLSWPNGLELDFHSNRLYWCDGQLSQIESVDFNGEDRQSLIDLSGSEGNHLFGVTSDENNVYWSNWAAGMLMKIGKTDQNTNGTSFGFKGFTKINDISLYNSRITRQGTTACSIHNGNCSNLCLPVAGGRTCACADGIDLIQNNGTVCEGAVQCPESFKGGKVIDCERFPFDLCLVSCDPGYEVQLPEVKCQSNGEWNTSMEDLCKAIECEDHILNPSVFLDECIHPYMFNTTCTFQCAVGTLQNAGNTTRKCMQNGSWSGEPLSCQAVSCPPLIPPDNGLFYPSTCSSTDVLYNRICGLGCSNGYELSGSRTHICLGDGTWSSAFEGTECIDVEPPTFGDSCPGNMTKITPHGDDTMTVTWQVPTATDNTKKAVNVTSDAMPPITMGEGERLITYTAIDASENKATCTFGVIVEVRRCETLQAPLHGHVGDVNCGNHLGTSCEVVCNEGYYMVGADSNRTCTLQNGQPIWTGQQPQCSNVICPEVLAPEHVLKAACSPPYVLHTECQYICQKGYNKVGGSDRQTCAIDGDWTGSLIQCEIQTCEALSPFDHGIISPVNCTTVDGRYGDECTFTCEENYELQGTETHVCGNKGVWSNMDDEHMCQDPSAPKLGKCPTDFQVFAARNETTATTAWQIPTSYDENGQRLNVTSSKPNGVVLAEGNHTVVLTATDSNGKNVSCRFQVTVTVYRCTEHPPFEHGLMIGECADHYGASCQFACEMGFLLTGSQSRTCELIDGNNNVFGWTGSMPACGENLCPMFPLPDNGLIQGCDATQPQPYQTQCQIQCAEGYNQVSGDNIRMCLDNSTWDGVPLACQGVECSTVSIEGVLVYPARCSEGGTYQDECHFACRDGYALRGALSQYCSATGQWTQNDNDTHCEDVTPPVFTDCVDELPFQAEECQRQALVNFADPKAVDNSGYVRVSALTVLFEGLPTYLPDGEFRFNYIAEDNARNSARCSFKVVVTVTECPALPFISNMEIDTSCNNLLGSVATFRCSRAYSSLVGPSNRTCLATGRWSEDSNPYCNEIMCKPLRSQVDGRVMHFVYPYSCKSRPQHVGQQCHMRCPFGYQPRDGTSTVRCLPSGEWTSLIGKLCVDITPPRFIVCPSTITKYLAPSKSTAQVRWDNPRPFDTSGVYNLTSPSIVQPLIMGPGVKRLNYMATDGSGNKAYCIFSIYVIDLQPPVVKICPDMQALKSDTLPIEFKWHHSPEFVDNVNVTNVDYSIQKGDLVYEWGEYSVTITAHDEAGSTAKCTMLIEAVPTDPCKPLAPPKNGLMNCKAHHCTATCRDGYVFMDGQTRHKHNCDMALGRWNHGNPTDPQPYAQSCSQVISANEIHLERQDALVFSHPTPLDCRNTSSSRQTQIQNLLDTSKFMTLCQIHEEIQCSFKDISSQCAGNRLKRSTTSLLRNEVGVMFTFVAKSSNADLLEQMLKAINVSINDLWPGREPYLDINGDRATLAPSLSTKGKIQSVCPQAQYAVNHKCVRCPPGTFYDIYFKMCLPCNVGTYQDKEGQLACIPCPTGTSTAGSNAFSSQHCELTCRPGNYSYLGIQPCNRCAISTYQSRSNSRFCTRCPNDVKTRGEGSASVRECIGYETYSTPSPSAIPTRVTNPANRDGQTSTQTAALVTTNNNNNAETATLKDTEAINIIIIVIVAAVSFMLIVLVSICIIKRRRKWTFKPHRLSENSQPVSNMFQELGEMQTLCFENQTYDTGNVDKLVEDEFGYGMLEDDNTSLGKPLTTFKVDENDDLLATL